MFTGLVTSPAAELPVPVGADDRPRLLVLSPVIPAPLDRGQNVRIHNLVLGLARQFRVTLVVPDGPALEEESALWDAVDHVVSVPVASRRPTPRELLRFMVRHRTVVRPGVVAWLQPFRAALDGLPLDEYAGIWVERLGMARLVTGAARRVVVDLDDLEHRKWARELGLHARAGISRTSLRQLYYMSRFFLHEVVLARRFAGCAVSSATDATYLRRWGVRNSALLPNGAAIHSPGLAPRRARTQQGPGRVVFLGNLEYAPNVDALLHFEESVRPVLDDLGSSVEVSVVGPGVTDALRAQFPRIEFEGFVEDLASALSRFDVCIVPLRLGGGTKLKVLDAMATGTPVVTTSVGAEGLRLTDGVHALIADSPQDFARAMTRVLSDAELASSLGEAGRRLVEEEYSWRSVQAKAVALMSRVVGDRLSAGPLTPGGGAAPHNAFPGV